MTKLFLDSDCEFTLEEAKKLNATLICMPYNIKGKEYIPYVDFKEYDPHEYFEILRGGVLPTTSALNPEDYIKYFEPEFKKGNDIFYIHFSTVMSGSFNSMRIALENLHEQYPERKFYEFDTKGITIMEYIVAREMAKLFNSGKSAEEVIAWGNENVDKFACYFFADDLKFFAKSGRVKGIAAVMGNLMGIRPILTMGTDGKMGSIGKVKGRVNAVAKLVDYVAELGTELDKYEIIIGHADNTSLVEALLKQLHERIGKDFKYIVVPVNPTAGAHCGPDTLGIAFRAIHR